MTSTNPSPGAVPRAPVPTQSTSPIDSITLPLKELRPDYVFEVPLNTTVDITPELSQLVETLKGAGFFVQIHPGNKATVLGPGSVFVFVRLGQLPLVDEHLISGVRDYTSGIQKLLPTGGTLSSDLLNENLTPADRLRLVYYRLTNPDSGLGITPGVGKWSFISSIFPVHDAGLNDKWLSRWTHSLVIGPSEIDWIRAQFGEKVAIYFAFLQHYFTWLAVPALVGLFVHIFVGAYSIFFAIFNIAWAVVYLNSWGLKENSLALQWGTKGVSLIETSRPKFVPEKWIKDPITNKTVPTASYWNRVAKQLSTIPMIISAAGAVFLLQIVALSLEIFFTQAYQGPLKFAFKFSPTVVLAAVVPVVVSIYRGIVTKTIHWENHQTEDSHSYSFNQKLFAISLLVSTGNLFLTAFVYLPFGHNIAPHLTYLTDYVNYLTGTTLADSKGFVVNGSRLEAQVVYMMVTAQIIAFGVEAFVPTVVRKVTQKLNERKTGEPLVSNDVPLSSDDIYLTEIREQAPLATFDVDAQYQKMIVQFAFVVIFGSVWPLAALASFINNFIQLRLDARKIVVDFKRPIPQRAENIGKYWTKDISTITWIGAVVGPVLAVMYGSAGHTIDHLVIENLNHLTARTTGYLQTEKIDVKHAFEPTATKVKSIGSAHIRAPPRTILLTFILSEHAYLLFKTFTTFVFRKLTEDSSQSIEEDKEQYLMRNEVIHLQLKSNPQALELVKVALNTDKNIGKLTPVAKPTDVQKVEQKVETKTENIEQEKFGDGTTFSVPKDLTDEASPDAIEKMWTTNPVPPEVQVKQVVQTQLNVYKQKKEKRDRELKGKEKGSKRD